MHNRSCQNGDDGHLHFLLLDLLAHIFRRSSHHQSADEDRDDCIEQHAVETRAHSSKDHLIRLDIEERNETADAA